MTLQENIWQLSSQQRLASWYNFRKTISELDLQSALAKTSTLWSYAPYVTYYLDSTNTQDWPTPWQLLDENYYCDVAKTLGMLYTIALSDHAENTFELQILHHHQRREQINILVVNNEYVLNYEFDTIVNIDTISNDCALRYSYTTTDLKIQEY